MAALPTSPCCGRGGLTDKCELIRRLVKSRSGRDGVVAPRHASYWRDLGLAHYRGGPFEDRTGGLITFDADDAAQAQRAVREDPFVLEGLVEARWLKEWTPASE